MVGRDRPRTSRPAPSSGSPETALMPPAITFTAFGFQAEAEKPSQRPRADKAAKEIRFIHAGPGLHYNLQQSETGRQRIGTAVFRQPQGPMERHHQAFTKSDS